MTAITTAARLLREAANELKNAHTLGGDWDNELEALDAYNEHMATATTLEHMGRQCLAQIEEPAQPVAEICSASHDNAQFGERAIKPLRDISGFEYGTPLYAGAAPAAVARSITESYTLAEIKAKIASHDYNAELLLQHAMRLLEPVAAPALEAPAAETIAQAITDNFRDAGWSMPSIDAARVLEAVKSALGPAAAPQAPAAPVGLPWRTGIPPWTDDRSVRVIAVTAQDDFGGVQVHDIRSSDFHTDGDGDGAEVARVCTHWAYRDDIWPRANAVAPAAPIPWDNFPAYLIDHCEGQTITEEGLQRALSAMLANPQYAGAAPAAPAVDAPAKGEVVVEVHGLTGSGKSAICGEIEIMCRALGLEVAWPGGESEKRMTHAEWTDALELYKPRVRIVERNHAAQAKEGGEAA